MVSIQERFINHRLICMEFNHNIINKGKKVNSELNYNNNNEIQSFTKYPTCAEHCVYLLNDLTFITTLQSTQDFSHHIQML